MTPSLEHDRMTKTRVIRFRIDGRWSVLDMGQFFRDLNDLAILSVSLRIPQLRERFHETAFTESEVYFKWVRGIVGYRRLLEIKRIQFGSPGFQDIAGAGVIIGHIKDFILRIIETVRDKEQHRLTTRKMELENVKVFIELASEYGLTPDELNYLIAQVNRKQQNIEYLIVEDKLVSVEYHDAE